MLSPGGGGKEMVSTFTGGLQVLLFSTCNWYETVVCQVIKRICSLEIVHRMAYLSPYERS